MIAQLRHCFLYIFMDCVTPGPSLSCLRSPSVYFSLPAFFYEFFCWSPNIIFHTGELKVKSICMQPVWLNERDRRGGPNKDGEWGDDGNAFTTTNAPHSKCQPRHSLLPRLLIYFISCHRLVCPSYTLTKWNMFLLSRCLMRQLSWKKCRI